MYSALDLSGKYLTYRSCFSSNLLTMSGSSDERRSLFLTSGVSPPQPSAGSLTQKKKTWGSRLYYYKLSILIVIRFIHEHWRIQGRGLGGPPPPPLFLEQNEVRRAEKMFFADWASPFLRVWMTCPPPPPPLSEGPDSPLMSPTYCPK